jgi:hypothetical protein
MIGFSYHINLILFYSICLLVGRGSSVGIATRLRAGRSGDRIPVGVRFSAPVQTGPGAHPASYTMGTGSLFPGVKRPGCVVDHLPSSSARVKERVELYLYTLWAFVACYRENITFTFICLLTPPPPIQVSVHYTDRYVFMCCLSWCTTRCHELKTTPSSAAVGIQTPKSLKGQMRSPQYKITVGNVRMISE